MRPFFPWCHCSMMAQFRADSAQQVAPVYTRALPQVLSLEQGWLCSVPPCCVCNSWGLCLCCPAWHRVTRTHLLQSLFTLWECSPAQPVQVGQAVLVYSDSCPLENCKVPLSRHWDSWNRHCWAYCILFLECSHFELFLSQCTAS